MTRAVGRARTFGVLGLVVVGSLAHADEAPKHPVRVTVTGPAACADSAGFVAALARRSTKLAPSPAAADTIAVELAEARGAVSGTLVVTRGGAASEPRSLEGASCDEVVRGLSLVAALVFDPEARLEPTPAPAVSTAAPPRDRAPASPAAPSWRLGAGGGAGAMALGADAMSLAVGAFVELSRDAGGLTPALRLGFLRTTATATATSAAFGPVTADLALTVARASGCFARWDLGAGARVRPCILADAGVLSGTAGAPVAGESRSRGWIAPGLTARIEWEIMDNAFLEAEGAAVLPLLRDELGVEPRLTLYRAPPAIGSVMFAAGLRFP